MANKIGFFFGAGTETAYDFPEGAEFAVNIINPRNEILEVAKDDYKNLCFVKKYGAFSKISSNDFQKICESMIENRKDEIKKLFLKSDEDFEKTHKDEKSEPLFDGFVGEFTEEKLPKFSLLLKSIKLSKSESEHEKNKTESQLSTLIKFNLSLVFFLYGKKITDKLNQKFINERYKNFFSDGNDFFVLDKSKAPLVSREIFDFLDEGNQKDKNKNQSDEEKILAELKTFTKDVVENCIDYQKLFENFDAAFYPEKNKTQFRKIVSLLFVMRQTIIFYQEKFKNSTEKPKSYYDEILSDGGIEIHSICTTNYSTFYDEKFAAKCGKNVFHLNGKIDSFFDIKAKSVLETENPVNENGNLVPFLYPQVAMKPVMYFDVVKMYADAYKSLSECSRIAVLGFGFNKDDNLLNGMFKTLLSENKNLEIFYFDYEKSASANESKFFEDLGISSECRTRFRIFKLEKDRTVGGKNWLEVLKG